MSREVMKEKKQSKRNETFFIKKKLNIKESNFSKKKNENQKFFILLLFAL